MTFLKYNSIENHYRSKEIALWLAKYPELADETYQIEEKIDGANIQLLFTPNQPFRVGKRSSFLGKGENFYDIWNVLEGYEEELAAAQKYSDYADTEIRLYGEIYGHGIQKRINYGADKFLIFYDVMDNGFFLSPRNAHNFLIEETGFVPVPVLDEVVGLQKALDYSNEFKSKMSPTGDMAEGFIIRPVDNYYFDRDTLFLPGSNNRKERFILKSKSAAFAEKSGDKSDKVVKELGSEVLSFSMLFKKYINENRVAAVMSKYGEISKPNQLGEYIKLVMHDAQNDFLKDIDLDKFNGLTDKEKRIVFNVGGDIVNIIKGKYL